MLRLPRLPDNYIHDVATSERRVQYWLDSVTGEDRDVCVDTDRNKYNVL